MSAMNMHVFCPRHALELRLFSSYELAKLCDTSDIVLLSQTEVPLYCNMSS